MDGNVHFFDVWRRNWDNRSADWFAVDFKLNIIAFANPLDLNLIKNSSIKAPSRKPLPGRGHNRSDFQAIESGADA